MSFLTHWEITHLSIFTLQSYRIFLFLHLRDKCCANLLQSGGTTCDPMDCSLRGSSVHGILQARILEWVAMPSSRGSSSPRDRTLSSCGSCIAGRFFTAEPMTSTDSSLISYHPQKRMKYAIASNSPTNARIALWQKGLKVSEM